jgi:hypothetical protein
VPDCYSQRLDALHSEREIPIYYYNVRMDRNFKINIILATNLVAGSFVSAASQIPQCSLTLFTFLSVLEMKFLFALLQQTKMIEPHTLQYLLLLAFPIAVASTIVHNTFNSTVPSKPSMQFLLSKCSLVTLT